MKGWSLSFVGTDAGTFEESEEAHDRFAREFLKVQNEDLLENLSRGAPNRKVNWKKKKK